MHEEETGHIDESLFTFISRHIAQLTAIDLTSEDVGDRGVAILIELLASNSSVAQLNLAGNFISNYGAMRLADALAGNRHITHLNLSANNIGDDGAKALAAALYRNRTLITLNLEVNDITDAGIGALVEALTHNRSLTELNLEDNPFHDEHSRGLLQRYLAVNQAFSQKAAAERNSPTAQANCVGEKTGAYPIASLLNQTLFAIQRYCEFDRQQLQQYENTLPPELYQRLIKLP